MVDPTTANIGLAVPTRGSDTGTWDVPVNGNFNIIDPSIGGILTIGLNSSNISLSSAQFIYKSITFNSTLTANVSITFPSTFIKSYEIYNTCTGSSLFTVTLQAAGGGQVICAPFGEIVDIVSDGTNLRYKNLGRVGSYWDYAGSSIPAWVSGCTVAPYLNCDGTTFSSGTYPALFNYLGTTTLPNSKGKTRFALDQGAGLISSAVFSGTGVGATGGAQLQTIGSSNLPANIPYKDVGHSHTVQTNNPVSVSNLVAGSGQASLGTATTSTNTINITINPSTAAAGTGNALTTTPPAYIGGLTLIRAG